MMSDTFFSPGSHQYGCSCTDHHDSAENATETDFEPPPTHTHPRTSRKCLLAYRPWRWPPLPSARAPSRCKGSRLWCPSGWSRPLWPPAAWSPASQRWMRGCRPASASPRRTPPLYRRSWPRRWRPQRKLGWRRWWSRGSPSTGTAPDPSRRDFSRHRFKRGKKIEAWLCLIRVFCF